MESPDRGSPVSGIVLEFPVSDGVLSCTPPTVPERLRKRLSEPKTPSPSTVEEIEAKLREADLRRQKFYEDISSKARPKPRSPSLTSSNEKNLRQRLEAKLQAAEEKRLSILANDQMRLAKLDESRQATKTQVEMRLKKECAELGTKVNMRVQQAEVNRLLFLKSYWQRRAALKERTTQSLMWRAARETKYKERVRAAMYQKRVNAEKKRLGLLEAEKQRARARVLQVRKVAGVISRQRQIERVNMMNKLEDRLQRARRKRAEYIKQRGRLSHSFDSSLESMHVKADILAQKLARCWRKFTKLNRTTAYLVKAFNDLDINETSVKSMPFEQFSVLIQSNATLRSTKALLDRLEVRYRLSRCIPYQSSWDDLDHLLKRVATPNKESPRKVVSHGRGKRASTRSLTQSSFHSSRYLVRIVLCAYMIVGHPDAVISGKGERETALVKSAEKFVKEFDVLVKILLNGPLQIPKEETDSGTLTCQTFRSQLAAFDSAWCSYLNSFVVWKTKDARSLEEDLIRAACRLELSMIQTCKMNPEGDNGLLSHDMKAIQKQVSEDHKLLREKVMHLSGDAGIERIEKALYDTRTNYFGSRENGIPDTSLTIDVLSPKPLALSSIDDPDKASNLNMGSQKQSSVVRTLFKAEIHPKDVSSPALSHSVSEFSRGSLEMENVRIVNEYVHGERLALDDISNSADEQSSSIMAKVKDTMERAFWDRVIESLRQKEPDYSHVVELMREVRDGICSMAPQSWRQETIEAIDLDIFTQVLNTGTLDLDYLGKILEHSLNTLRKLSAPAYEDELKKKHLQFMKDLAEECASDNSQNSQVIALIKGLRFTLEQIQELKQEISKAHIRRLEPFLKGRDALYFLGEAFAERFGPPSNSLATLPLTAKWISSVQEGKDEEWNEHRSALLELTKRNENQISFLPSTTLRSGGSAWVKTSRNQTDASASDYTETTNVHPQCEGEDVDLLVRLGLLKLVIKIAGWTEAELPETMNLNFFRLRNVQSRVQKIIVVATSVLILGQTLLTRQIVSSQSQIHNMLSDCIKQLSQCLDSVADATIHDIIKILIATIQKASKSEDSELEPTKEIMARMLSKSLQEEDAVFSRVSRAIYLALRGVTLGGTGKQGRELAEIELNKIGASLLLDEVVQAATVLVMAAKVSVAVHGPWYSNLVSK